MVERTVAKENSRMTAPSASSDGLAASRRPFVSDNVTIAEERRGRQKALVPKQGIERRGRRIDTEQKQSKAAQLARYSAVGGPTLRTGCLSYGNPVTGLHTPLQKVTGRT